MLDQLGDEGKQGDEAQSPIWPAEQAEKRQDYKVINPLPHASKVSSWPFPFHPRTSICRGTVSVFTTVPLIVFALALSPPAAAGVLNDKVSLGPDALRPRNSKPQRSIGQLAPCGEHATTAFPGSSNARSPNTVLVIHARNTAASMRVSFQWPERSAGMHP